jgi:hypothetical protein
MEKKEIGNNEIVVIERPLFTLNRDEQSLLLGGTNSGGNGDLTIDDEDGEFSSCQCKQGKYRGDWVPGATCMCKKGEWIATS